MSLAKLAPICAAAALTLSACGTINVKPTASAGATAASRGRIDDPRTFKNNHVGCLRANNLAVRDVGATGLVVAHSVRVVFLPTPGAAQADQIQDVEQGAEVIGSALVYPGHASDSDLNKIEHCIAQGVSG
jgi:hypothetical protein